jgi:hypothetical protein
MGMFGGMNGNGPQASISVTNLTGLDSGLNGLLSGLGVGNLGQLGNLGNLGGLGIRINTQNGNSLGTTLGGLNNTNIQNVQQQNQHTHTHSQNINSNNQFQTPPNNNTRRPNQQNNINQTSSFRTNT